MPYSARSSVFALCFTLTAMTGALATDDLLQPYLWENRVLLVFAPQPEDSRLQLQNKILAGVAGELRERDLVVIRILRGTRVSVDAVPVDSAQAAILLRDFDIDPGDFKVLLIGKDGTLKQTYTDPVTRDGLFELIDSMPMRKWEMQSQDSLNNQD